MKALFKNPTWWKFKLEQSDLDHLILLGLWLMAAVCDRLWFYIDQAPPLWDQGDHLTRAMHYWRVLQQPHLLSQAWWTELWQQSSTYRAPLVYLLTVPFLALFGAGYDQAALVNLLFTGILLVTIYHLGRRLFSAQVGLWGAGVCLLLQTLAYTRLDYLLDYGVTASITVAFACLTFWRYATLHAWRWMVATGLALGAVFLSRPTGVLFLAVPLIWLAGETLVRRQWLRLGQLVGAVGLAIALGWGWFSTSWLTILSSIVQANRVGAVHEGDPQANTLAGWLYYAHWLPTMTSPLVVIVAFGCGAIWLGRWLWQSKKTRGDRPAQAELKSWAWLLGFVAGIYVLCALAGNKDFRFIQPYLPVVGLLLARTLTLGVGRWWMWLRWSTVTLASLLLLGQLFPLLGSTAVDQHYPYLGPAYPHKQIIAEVIKTQPYLRSTIGMVVNTAHINPPNVDFYGAIASFQVHGRELAFFDQSIPQDSRALDWYLTKTSDQRASQTLAAQQKPLSPRAVRRKQLTAQLESSPALDLQRTWQLPDASELRLYHRRTRSITAMPTAMAAAHVKLAQITLPTASPPGKPIPVTYTWLGTWADLRDGLVLLNWVKQSAAVSQGQQPHLALPALNLKPEAWLHDHGIGLGQLYAGKTPPGDRQGFQVVERLAMQPPTETASGTYQLQATYLNRQTGQSYPLSVPTTALVIDPQVAPQVAPEVDLITQFRRLSALLPQGKLEPLFNEIGRINQYDPIQDYIPQLEKILNYRLQTAPDRPDLLYTLGLVYVLQRQPEPAIATFTRLTQLDSQNAWAWAYLGLLRLYNFQPQRATIALNQAETIQPGISEVQTLRIVAAAMRLDLPTVRRLLKK